MNEAMLEEIMEKRMDALDRRFLTSNMTQSEYDAAVEAMNAEFKPKFERARALSNIRF